MAEKKLAAVGLELPKVSSPIAVYKSCVIVGNIAYLSGHPPRRADGTLHIGKVDPKKPETIKAGVEAARDTALVMMATLKAALGSLDKVKRTIKLTGFVNCTDDFTQQPTVINGCSELFKEVFGDNGVGTRAALGANSLPSGIIVEIEGIFEIET
eukprot:TRINITY_DN19843_c0_g1_i1.p2 TRINITY_DN19843_c0_g1~~TRINITY_DN19843_c0_g1_i1.p2  ORF type:complete len:163 (+),score=38.23 TRINITY_DN19843_c0_g1_i1:27-491(+)